MPEYKDPQQFWTSVKNIRFLSKIIFEKRDKRDKSVKRNNTRLLNTDFCYEENTNIFISNIQNKEIHSLCSDIFLDMQKYKFENAYAVNGITIESKEKKNDLDLLNRRLKLHKHTFNVINEVILNVENSFGFFKDLFLIAALVHDYGKCYELLNAYEIVDNSCHWKESAEYLNLKIESAELSDYNLQLLTFVADAINIHHDKPKLIKINNLESENKPTNESTMLILKYLKRADTEARTKEIKEIKKALKDKVNDL